MKKYLILLLSIVFFLSLVLGPSSVVSAANWELPTITPLTGDKEFNFKTANPTDPQFTAITENGLVVPAGFPLGQKQFGGEIAIINGLNGGSARLCFSFPTYRYGWDGGIYQWDGARWNPVASTLTESKDDGAASVCTTITGDGSYALIIGFAHPEKTTADLPVCSADFEASTIPFYIDGDGESFETISFIVLLINQNFSQGTPIRYQVINVSPPGSLSGALSQRGYVYNDEGPTSVIFFLNSTDLQEFIDTMEDLSDYVPPSYTYITFHYIEGWENLTFTVRVTTPDCYKDFIYNDFFSEHGT